MNSEQMQTRQPIRRPNIALYLCTWLMYRESGDKLFHSFSWRHPHDDTEVAHPRGLIVHYSKQFLGLLSNILHLSFANCIRTHGFNCVTDTFSQLCVAVPSKLMVLQASRLSDLDYLLPGFRSRSTYKRWTCCKTPFRFSHVWWPLASNDIGVTVALCRWFS